MVRMAALQQCCFSTWDEIVAALPDACGTRLTHLLQSFRFEPPQWKGATIHCSVSVKSIIPKIQNGDDRFDASSTMLLRSLHRYACAEGFPPTLSHSDSVISAAGISSASALCAVYASCYARWVWRREPLVTMLRLHIAFSDFWSNHRLWISIMLIRYRLWSFTCCFTLFIKFFKLTFLTLTTPSFFNNLIWCSPINLMNYRCSFFRSFVFVRVKWLNQQYTFLTKIF